MAKDQIIDLSKTTANNTDFGGVNYAEGMVPSMSTTARGRRSTFITSPARAWLQCVTWRSGHRGIWPDAPACIRRPLNIGSARLGRSPVTRRSCSWLSSQQDGSRLNRSLGKSRALSTRMRARSAGQRRGTAPRAMLAIPCKGSLQASRQALDGAKDAGRPKC